MISVQDMEVSWGNLEWTLAGLCGRVFGCKV